jgi:phosphoglycolate phosphatase-like HAD superfamily hydrolase
VDCTAAIFDVDGTLVDSNYLHVITWWQALAKVGDDVPMSDIHRTIGMGSDQLLDHLLPPERDRRRDDAIRAGHDALFSVYWPHLRPLPGAAALLRACKRRGQRVVQATSAGANELQATRSALDADDVIDEITSSEDVERPAAPDLVEVALAKAAVGPGQVVFVGDTVWDVRAPLVAIRPGDVAHTPGGEWQCHGAAPDHFMTHLSLTEGNTDWGDHVDDGQG